MPKKCCICNEKIEEEYNKLKGTMLKVKENNKNNFIYVCNNCQKQKNWIEKAKVKAA
jgi:hypothetical protein